MNRNIKVSIIIPIYNTEQYIKEAVLSISQQTLKEIEIILINDGSTDSSSKIIETMAQQDARIQIITTKNNGISIARNIGFHIASGEYIYFFDSDDILEQSTLETCYHKCHSQNLDFCFFDGLVIGNIKHPIYHPSFYIHTKNLNENKVYSGKEILNIQLTKDEYRSPVCLNFIKREFLEDIKLTFYPYILHEDELFTFLLYLKANRVSCIKQPFFYRRIRNNSIMTNSYSIKNAINYLTICKILSFHVHQYKKKDIEHKLIQKRINSLISIIYFSAEINLPYTEKVMIFQKIIKEIPSLLNWKLSVKLKYPMLYKSWKKIKSWIN